MIEKTRVNDFDQRRITFAGAHGLTIAGTAVGPTDGLPVILSHGGGQTRYAWGRTAHSLAELGFLAISLDLRGHGESGWMSSGLYVIEDYAEDLRLFSATLARPPILVGASLGGIASLLAAGEPAYAPISGLCLVDVSPHLKSDGVAGILGFMRETSKGFDTPEQAADAIAAYVPHRPRPTDIEGLRKNLREGEDGRFYWHWDPQTIARPLEPERTSKRLEQAAAHIDAPALLLRGELSELVTADVAKNFMALFNRGATVDIPGARHMVAGDRNDLFGRELIAFAENIRNERTGDVGQ
ncbi:alpha/beta fold hydrolase [Sphingobium phenoxybenzoativorans]|uniref:alpha/beta fold hydrolase n=1 Tax=Sphingobium phenoxybenzoativorans TaxID=1592790 RepID=UPI0008724E0E|nr:alpha/beta hydrolase [Sphingobium phenoxybenzoativorans]